MKNNALAPKVLEQSVVREVDNLLNLCQIFHWRNQTGALKPAKSSRPIHYGKPGSADFLGICSDGRFLAVECKRPVGGITSDLQKKFLDEINRRGGVGIVVTSAADCYAQLKEAGVIR
jgi:hypothetical protein